MDEIPLFKEFVSASVLAKIEEMLSKCTDGQRGMYARLYPRGPTYEQLPTAFDQVRRTVMENAKISATGDQP